MKYSLKKVTKTITLEKEDGTPDELTLKEMTAAQRDVYLDNLSKRVSVGKDGKAQGVSRFEGLQADLISSCLYRGESKVTSEEIQSWPATVVADIFKEAQSLNRLDQENMEAGTKNE